MRRPSVVLPFLLIAISLSASENDAKAMLRQAAAKYRDAKSFHLEWETKITSASAFASGWQKQTFVVAGEDRKFHYEAKGTALRGLRISDGQSDWFYQSGLRQYSVQPSQPDKARVQARGTAGGTTEGWVKTAMQSLLRVDDDAESSEILGDEVVTIGTAKFPCLKVHARQLSSFREGVTSTRENTYWIEKSTGLIRKAVFATNGPSRADDDVDEQSTIVEINYSRVELDTVPDAALFEFTPPANTYLVDDSRQPVSAPLRVGTPAPALIFDDKKTGTFNLAELKGKVALVQFWASWCGACLEEMKALAQLPKSYADKGLVIVGVDEDEMPLRGDDYFSSQKFQWKNFHDQGEINQRVWGLTSYPLLVLVDREGKIVWTNSGVGTGFSSSLRSQLDKPELGLAP
ncbi:MAG: hypothetical protein JWO13_3144 [Acidobacteriales bacterium]|nr:hypothetical protein [Terriglobales bacterium]